MSRNRNRNRRKPAAQQGQQPGQQRVNPALPGSFTFKHEGRYYTLPPADKALQTVKAGGLMDAVKESSDMALLKLAVLALEGAAVDAETMHALREQSLSNFADIAARWMRSAGVNPGE